MSVHSVGAALSSRPSRLICDCFTRRTREHRSYRAETLSVGAQSVTIQLKIKVFRKTN